MREFREKRGVQVKSLGVRACVGEKSEMVDGTLGVSRTRQLANAKLPQALEITVR